MSQDNLTYEDLLRIVELIKSSEQFSEFRLKTGEIEIELRRRDASGTTEVHAMQPAAPATLERHVATPVNAAAANTRSAPSWPHGSIVIRSPMVGTFYRAPQPGAPPFVGVGEKVAPDTTVCIIEVMKLMNSIAAGVHGQVLQVLVDDAAAVEAGQALIVLSPADASS